MKGDISRLPVWAQDIINGKDREIKRLEADLAQERRALNPDADSATVIADPGSKRPWAVGDVVIRFTNGDVHFDARFDRQAGVLEVTRTAKGSSGIAVLPSVTNTVRLAAADPTWQIARELEREAQVHDREANMVAADEAGRDARTGHSGVARGLREAVEVVKRVLR